MSEKTYGRIGYEAYAASTGGKTFDGRDMPTWEQILERTPHVAKAWDAAGMAIAHAHARDFAASCDALPSTKRNPPR